MSAVVTPYTGAAGAAGKHQKLISLLVSKDPRSGFSLQDSGRLQLFLLSIAGPVLSFFF